jgi:hypothetical protein
MTREVRDVANIRTKNVKLYLDKLEKVNGFPMSPNMVYPAGRPFIEAVMVDQKSRNVYDGDETTEHPNHLGVAVNHVLDSKVTVQSDTSLTTLNCTKANHLVYGTIRPPIGVPTDTAFKPGKVTVIFPTPINITSHVGARTNSEGVKMMSEAAIISLCESLTGKYNILEPYGTTDKHGIELGSRVSVDGETFEGAFALRPPAAEGHELITVYGDKQVTPDRIKLVCSYSMHGDIVTAKRVITIIVLDAVERVAVLNLPTFTTLESEYGVERFKNIHFQGCHLEPSDIALVRERAAKTPRWSRLPLGVLMDGGRLEFVPDEVTHIQIRNSHHLIPFNRDQRNYGISRVAGIEVHDVILTIDTYEKEQGHEATRNLIDKCAEELYQHYLQFAFKNGDDTSSFTFQMFCDYIDALLQHSVNIGAHNEFIEYVSDTVKPMCAHSLHMTWGAFIMYHTYCLTHHVLLTNRNGSEGAPLIMSTMHAIPYICPIMPDQRGFAVNAPAKWTSGLFKHCVTDINLACSNLGVARPYDGMSHGIVSSDVPVYGHCRGILARSRDERGNSVGRVTIRTPSGDDLCLDHVIQSMVRMLNDTGTERRCGIIYDRRFALFAVRGKQCANVFVTTSTKMARLLPSTKNSDSLVKRSDNTFAYVHEMMTRFSGYVKSI